MWYLSERVRGKSMQEIVSKFSNNTRSNDERVKQLVETRFGYSKADDIKVQVTSYDQFSGVSSYALNLNIGSAS
jgi:hypothetical protein